MESDERLSRMLTDYIGYGEYAIPRCVWNKSESLEAEDSLRKLRVIEIVAEVRDYEIEWAAQGLTEAASEVREATALRHPELNESALDALGWLFAYEWK